MLVVGQCVPLVARKLVRLCEHEIVVTVGIDKLVDSGRGAKHHVQGVHVLARLYVEPYLAIIVHALVVDGQRLGAHAWLLGAHLHIVDVAIEQGAIGHLRYAFGHNVKILSSRDEACFASSILHAIVKGKGLCSLPY